MGNLTDSAIWEAGIYQLEETDVVLGGSTGISNTQAKQLANRTAWLKNAIRGFDELNFLSASKTLTAADVIQKLVIINGGATSQTYNLPVGISAGTRVSIMAYNVTKQVTINSQGTNDIVLTGSLRQKLYLGDGESIQLVWSGDHWFLISHDSNILTVGLPFYSYIIKPNTIVAEGQEISRSDYPRIWEFAAGLGASLVSDLQWNSVFANRGFFSTGNGATTFRVPDLRSMFLRSLDKGRGLDYGRISENPGGYEEDAFKSHTHTTEIPSRDFTNFGDNGPDLTASPANDNPGNKQTFISSSAGNALETRPKNIGLLPLIYI